MRKIVLSVILSLLVVPAFAAKYATVGSAYANIRSCAGPKCSVKWKAWKYTPLYMSAVSKDKQWVQVSDFDNHIGWIHHTMLSSVKGLSATTDLNVRSAASSSADKVCIVQKGYAFKYLSVKGSWYEVEDDPADSKKGVCRGWVYGANLWGPRAKGQSPD